MSTCNKCEYYKDRHHELCNKCGNILASNPSDDIMDRFNKITTLLHDFLDKYKCGNMKGHMFFESVSCTTRMNQVSNGCYTISQSNNYIVDILRSDIVPISVQNFGPTYMINNMHIISIVSDLSDMLREKEILLQSISELVHAPTFIDTPRYINDVCISDMRIYTIEQMIQKYPHVETISSIFDYIPCEPKNIYILNDKGFITELEDIGNLLVIMNIMKT